MKDYQTQLDKHKNFPKYQNNAEGYFKKYWLDKKELDEVWLKIKNKIFNKDFHQLPDRVINQDIEVIILKGGIVLIEKEFIQFQSCMKRTGDKFFIVLEDYDENNPPHISGPPYRLKFPADITWEEMTSRGDPSFISYDVFMRPIRNYFVFGDSGAWGKYAGNDYEFPLDIVGFNKKYSSLFHDKFKIPEEDIADLKEWTAFYGMKLPSHE
jgi:hypothetical protein